MPASPTRQRRVQHRYHLRGRGAGAHDGGAVRHCRRPARLVTGGQYIAAAGVISVDRGGVFFQGVYLLTSIGLNITKRTQYYPVSTAIGRA